MGCIKTISAASVMVALFAYPALAADYPARAPVIEQTAVVPEELGTGWYLRGDIGYSRQAKPNMAWVQTGFTSPTTYSGVSAKDAMTFGLGFGYKLNEWFRADLTFDKSLSYQVRGALNATTVDQAKIDTFTVMANGYLDAGNFYGFTPYIGAGLGVARIDTSKVSRTVSGVAGTGFLSANRYSFAAAGMTGFSYDLGSGIQADVGYRYLCIDQTQSGRQTAGLNVYPVTFKNNASHQFRVGLRYFMN